MFLDAAVFLSHYLHRVKYLPAANRNYACNNHILLMKQLVWKHSNRRKMNDKLRERGENSGKQRDMMDTDRTNWNAKLPTGIAMNKPLRKKKWKLYSDSITKEQFIWSNNTTRSKVNSLDCIMRLSARNLHTRRVGCIFHDRRSTKNRWHFSWPKAKYANFAQ